MQRLYDDNIIKTLTRLHLELLRHTYYISSSSPGLVGGIPTDCLNIISCIITCKLDESLF